MALYRAIAVENQDPLNSVRTILGALWEQAGWDGMLVPAWQEPTEPPRTTLLTSHSDVWHADPFAPIMLHNAAALAAQTIESNPTNHFAILLRPCEYRSLLILAGKRGLNLKQHVIISTDCLGTLPEADYHKRALQEEHPETLSYEALRFADQEGIIFERYRLCCQICTQFTINNADVQIYVIGVDTHKHVILGLTDESKFGTLNIDHLAAREKLSGLLDRRERTLVRIMSWRQQALDFTSSHLADQYKSLSGLQDHLISCRFCREHLEQHCPQFQARWLAEQNGQELVMLEAWLRSCSGCGMCSHECPQGYPLFESIRFLMGKFRRQML